MEITRLEHIIFDFDGVIADTFDMNWGIVQWHDPHATLDDFIAHHDGNVYAEPKVSIKEENQVIFIEQYRNALTTGHLAKAVPPIQRLGKRYALHVISSTSESVIQEVLGQAGLLPLFGRIMGMETHRSKVEKFKMLMESHGVTSLNSIFITDTLGDIKEAHKLNIRAVAETFGFHDRSRLLQGNPYRIADSWDEIEDIIQNL